MYGELKLVMKGFSRVFLIGEGGFGCVYRGVVDGFDLKINVVVK